MDQTIKKIIDDALEKNLNSQYINRETIIRLLEIDPGSDECEYLGKAAREIARARTKNIARVGSSIGLDLAPCTMSCRFCSLGEKWGLIDKEYSLSDDLVIELIRGVLEKGHFQITLRTTEFYDQDRLCKLAERIRSELGWNFGLTANTGELTSDSAQRLYDAGFTGVYHTLRLREGIDTPFDPDVRIATMRAVSESPLMLSCGIDPIGIEHTNEEIADRLMLFRTLNPAGVCSMRRVNVVGTPMEGIEEVSDIRIAQIAAVIRMASAGRWTVSVHPPIQKAIEWGANNVAVETGANPRGDSHDFDIWGICDQETAERMFLDAGYTMGRWSDFRRFERD